jgi:hypothetical protein
VLHTLAVEAALRMVLGQLEVLAVRGVAEQEHLVLQQQPQELQT